MDLNTLLKNPMKFVKDINTLKETINVLDAENLQMESSMESSKLKLLNDIIPTIEIKRENYANELDVMLGLTGTNKTKKDLENITGKFIYLLSKHMWCLYLTDKISYDVVRAFYLNLFGIDIEKIPNSILDRNSIEEYLDRTDPRRDPRDSRYDPRYRSRRDSRDPSCDPRDPRCDPRFDPRFDPRDPRYDPRLDPRDVRYDPRYASVHGSRSSTPTPKLNTSNIFLDFDPNRPSLTLQKMISDMRIRKKADKLYMKKDENHQINRTKIDEWIRLQCNQEAKDLAQIFKDNTQYVSWRVFYDNAKKVFDRLYTIVKDKSYCVFTKEALGNVSFEDKSNYWMLCLLIDHYINSGKTNLPKELLLCGTEQFTAKCPNSNYDYYISLDDCIYSGGQMFTDAIRTANIDPKKIIVVAPYVSEFAYDRFNGDKGTLYNQWIFAETMGYWWKDKIVSVGGTSYNLNNESERNQVFDLLKKYFPSPRRDKATGSIRAWGKNNFMYYFDHKIADYASSFPSVYHLGIISPDGSTEKPSTNTHDDSRNPSGVCLKTTYLPFVENCLNQKPIMDDIDEKAKTNPEKLCVEPWYKKKYTTTYDKKVLVLDFDETITDITIKDNEALTKSLDDIFKNKSQVTRLLYKAWEKMVPVYIVSRRQKDVLIQIINRFYLDQNITFQRIYENNILGRPKSFTYPSGITSDGEREAFWADFKVKYLDFIVDYEQVKKDDILFYDDSQLNIDRAVAGGYTNSIKVDGTQNAKQVLSDFSRRVNTNLTFKQKYLTHIQTGDEINDTSFKTKYQKYKQKYLELKDKLGKN